MNGETTYPLIDRVQGLKFHGEDQSNLGNILLILSACGILGYSTMNVIAGGLGAHNDIKNLLVFGTGDIGIMQARKKIQLGFQFNVGVITKCERLIWLLDRFRSSCNSSSSPMPSGGGSTRPVRIGRSQEDRYRYVKNVEG